MRALALALMLCAVPAEDEATPDLTGQWLSSVGGQDDFGVTINRLPDGTLVSRWHDLDTGLVRYRGTLAYDAKAGEWREEYDPGYTRCGDWCWHTAGEALHDQRGGRGWVLRRPGAKPPDL